MFWFRPASVGEIFMDENKLWRRGSKNEQTQT